MKFGSLFAGIGGFDLGLERAGMRCAWQVEIDPFCRRVLAKHWPNVTRFEDVRHVGRNELGAVDLICGGFPCQPHSLAGKRLGAADDRDLWPEYRRIVSECRPRWVLAENVPGIRTTILDQVLADLESLNYSTRAIVIPACAFDAPHRRSRIFIVAHANRPDQGRRQQQEWGLHQRNAILAGHGPQGNVANVEKPGLSQRITFGFEQDAEENEWHMAQPRPERYYSSWWSVEPDVVRVANGIPVRVDRLRALGNAVVPQVVEWLGRMILETDNANPL